MVSKRFLSLFLIVAILILPTVKANDNSLNILQADNGELSKQVISDAAIKAFLCGVVVTYVCMNFDNWSRSFFKSLKKINRAFFKILFEPKLEIIEPQSEIIESKLKVIESKLKAIESKLKVIEPKLEIIESKLKVINNAPNKANIDLVCSNTKECSPHVGCIITNKYIITLNGFKGCFICQCDREKLEEDSFQWSYKDKCIVQYRECNSGQREKDYSEWSKLSASEKAELEKILEPTKYIFYYNDPRHHARKNKLKNWDECEHLKNIYSMEHTKIVSRPEPERTRGQWEVNYPSDLPNDASIIPLSLFDSKDGACDFIIRGLANLSYPEKGYTIMLGNGAKKSVKLGWEDAFDRFNAGKNKICDESFIKSKEEN